MAKRKKNKHNHDIEENTLSSSRENISVAGYLLPGVTNAAR